MKRSQPDPPSSFQKIDEGLAVLQKNKGALCAVVITPHVQVFGLLSPCKRRSISWERSVRQFLHANPRHTSILFPIFRSPIFGHYTIDNLQFVQAATDFKHNSNPEEEWTSMCAPVYKYIDGIIQTIQPLATGPSPSFYSSFFPIANEFSSIKWENSFSLVDSSSQHSCESWRSI